MIANIADGTQTYPLNTISRATAAYSTYPEQRNIPINEQQHYVMIPRKIEPIKYVSVRPVQRENTASPDPPQVYPFKPTSKKRKGKKRKKTAKRVSAADIAEDKHKRVSFGADTVHEINTDDTLTISHEKKKKYYTR